MAKKNQTFEFSMNKNLFSISPIDPTSKKMSLKGIKCPRNSANKQKISLLVIYFIYDRNLRHGSV